MGGGRNAAFHVKERTHVKANIVECRLKQHTAFVNLKYRQ